MEELGVLASGRVAVRAPRPVALSPSAVLVEHIHCQEVKPSTNRCGVSQTCHVESKPPFSVLFKKRLECIVYVPPEAHYSISLNFFLL